MKILYAVQATGNGHISRAIEIMPELKRYGEVDVFLSGANATLHYPFPVKYKSKGLSLFYSRCGGLDFKKTWKEVSFLRARREARHLPVEDYDLVINDFEYITAQSCRMKKIPSVQFGHQASFMSAATPRPQERSLLGELILKKYAVATNYIGLHFQLYADFIFTPVIKSAFKNITPNNEGHITVYLPAYRRECLQHHLKALKDVHFHWFLPCTKAPNRIDNITFYPVETDLFNKSLASCHGIITGAGFETPAEALYLEKKLMSIPIQSQYEQKCNAAALQLMGETVIASADTDHFAGDISNWLSTNKPPARVAANNLKETLQYLVDTYPFSSRQKELAPAFD